MKKLVLFTAVVIAVAFASCKKTEAPVVEEPKDAVEQVQQTTEDAAQEAAAATTDSETEGAENAEQVVSE